MKEGTKIGVWGIKIPYDDEMQKLIPKEPQIWMWDECPCSPLLYLRATDGRLFYLGPMATTASYFLVIAEGRHGRHSEFPPVEQLQVLEVIIPRFERAN